MNDAVLALDDVRLALLPRRAEDRLKLGIPRDLTELPELPREHRDHTRTRGHAHGCEPGWYRNSSSTELFYVTEGGDWQRVRPGWKWKRAVAHDTGRRRDDRTHQAGEADAASTGTPTARRARSPRDVPGNGSVRYQSKPEAIEALAEWARVDASRDDRIRAAVAAGVGINEIARVTGVAKTTVIRVLK